MTRIVDQLDLDGNKIVDLADPTAAQDAATKAYVDTEVASVGGTPAASTVTFSPAQGIAATNVQAAIEEAVTDNTAAAILAKLLTVDTDTSGLNANTLQGNTLAQVQAAVVAAIVDSAPGTLDTLNELAAALQDNPDIITDILASLATKATKYAAAIGDGSATSFVVTHNLGTRDVIVSVTETASPYEHVLVKVVSTSTSTVTVGPFAVAPTAGQYRVVVHG